MVVLATKVSRNIGKIVRDKTNISPTTPEKSEVSLSGNSATIIWGDRSKGETGFIVVRRDSLDGQWVEIATVDYVSSI